MTEAPRTGGGASFRGILALPAAGAAKLLSRALHDIAQGFESAEGPEERKRRALELLRQVVAYDGCALLEALPGGGRRLVLAPEPAEERAALAVMLDGMLALLSEEPAGQSFGRQAAGALRGPWEHHLVVPLVGLDQVTGLLFVGRAGEPYNEHELSALSLVAAQVAAYLTTVRLHHAQQESVQKLDEARRVAEAADRAKDDFVAMLSHELRSPLTAMLGWSHLLQTGTLSEATRARALDIIVRSAGAQKRLLEDILDLSRSRTGKLRLELMPVEPRLVVEVAVEAARPLADAQSIRLSCEPGPPVGPVQGDAERLQQVVSNLLTNAIKFTPSGGRVDVRVERVGGHVRIHVSDTGRGISPDLLPSIFDRFFQAAPASRRGRDGLGLGLGITRDLVALHGGRVDARSPGEGMGSTFTIELPLAEGATPATPAWEGSAAPEGELRGVRVLVVDDSVDTREVLQMMLEHHGAAVTLAGSTREALAALDSSQVDVMVSDISMPGEDGYDLMREVVRRGVPLSAIALTAHSRDVDRDRALEAGFHVHLVKPIEPERLVASVASLAPAARAR